MEEKKRTQPGGLTVLEYPYMYDAWHVDPDDFSRAVSSRRAFSGAPRSVDYYRRNGIYERAGLPCTVEEITGGPYPALEPHQAIPLHFAEAARRAAEENRKLLISSGYCAFAPAVLGGLQQALGPDKRIGVVWMDAHCDNVLVEETDRSDLRFVGFPMSVIAGQTMQDWGRTYCRMTCPCTAEEILLGDGHCSGEEEFGNLRRAGIRRVLPEQFADAAYWRAQAESLAARVDAIYLMVDVDILKFEYIPAYFCYEPGGHALKTVQENIRAVMRTGKVAAFSCFCVDFDKYEQGGEITYRSAAGLIEAGLEAWA
ncbi:MAG: arginase family protein [Hominenteromicrobium sp.]